MSDNGNSKRPEIRIGSQEFQTTPNTEVLPPAETVQTVRVRDAMSAYFPGKNNEPLSPAVEAKRMEAKARNSRRLKAAGWALLFLLLAVGVGFLGYKFMPG